MTFSPTLYGKWLTKQRSNKHLDEFSLIKVRQTWISLQAKDSFETFSINTSGRFIDWKSTSTGFMTWERVFLRKSTTTGTHVGSIHIKTTTNRWIRAAPPLITRDRDKTNGEQSWKLYISKYQVLEQNNLWRHCAIWISIQSNSTLQ